MSSNIEETSISQLSVADKKNRDKTPNLWNLPKVDKSWERNLEELKKFQQTYTELLYKIGKDKYGLNPKSDFTVDVILPTGKFSDLSYHIIPGATCHLIFSVCPITEFEKVVHPILSKVKTSVHNKSLQSIIEIRKIQEKIKKIIPPFKLYNLEDHRLEIKREQKVIIYDPTTGITVTRTMPAESEPWRIMTHHAKTELIKLNKLIKEFESRDQNGTLNENENKVSVGSDNYLER